MNPFAMPSQLLIPKKISIHITRVTEYMSTYESGAYEIRRLLGAPKSRLALSKAGTLNADKYRTPVE